MSLLDLAERVEAATGADRELDAAIVRTVCPGAIVDIYINGDDEPTVWHAEPLARSKSILAAYTASLDAAMTLVPERWFTRFAAEDRHSHNWRWELRGGYGFNIAARAATPALALVAASLRARHALAKEVG